MLENTLENAEKPEDLIIYAGTGKCARNWECYDKIRDSLMRLEEFETLIVQSGKPVAIFRTHPFAPRVLIANANLVPRWATWDDFNRLESKGLTMYGQYTAGSWGFVGIQGVLQTTYETLYSVASKHFQGTLRGRLVVSGGMGAQGGNVPLATKMNGGTCIGIDVDENAIDRRIRTGHCGLKLTDIDEAFSRAIDSVRANNPLSIGLVGNAAEVFPWIVKKEIVPDVSTDMTPAHDPLAYIPIGLTVQSASELRKSDPASYSEKAGNSARIQLEAMLKLMKAGSVVFEYGNNLRGLAGFDKSIGVPSFVPAYIRNLFCEGRGPFRWIALSGNPDDIRKTEKEVLKMFPNDSHLRQWIESAQKMVPFEGLPARVCWLGFGERATFGKRLNEMVHDEELEAPVAFSRDNMDSGSIASPIIETEDMMDGSDAIADWPILNAMLNCSAMADLVALQQGGGSGMGGSIHSGMIVVCDGTKDSETRLETVLTTDSGIGIVRHADAGYKRALEILKQGPIIAPMLEGKKDT